MRKLKHQFASLKRAGLEPKEVVSKLAEAYTATQGDLTEEVEAETFLYIGELLAGLKEFLLEDNKATPSTLNDVVQFFLAQDLLPHLVKTLPKLDFEAKRHCMDLFNFLLHRKVEKALPTVEYLFSQPEILHKLFTESYSDDSISLYCGSMLRNCIRYKILAVVLINFPDFDLFFIRVQLADFGTASDHFATFKELLLTHKDVTIPFLTENYESFFGRFDELLVSENFATKSQALEVLARLLKSTCSGSVVVEKYIADPGHLKTAMRLVTHKSEMIRRSALSILPLFLVNPASSVLGLIQANGEKLASYIDSLDPPPYLAGEDRENEREAWTAEKIALVKRLQLLSSAGDKKDKDRKEGPDTKKQFEL